MWAVAYFKAFTRESKGDSITETAQKDREHFTIQIVQKNTFGPEIYVIFIKLGIMLHTQVYHFLYGSLSMIDRAS